MRAREFIVEKKAKTNPAHKAGMQPSLVFPDMDAGYDYYRYMNVIASHPHHKAPHDHEHFRDHPLAIAYTPEEKEMLEKSLKGLGHKMKWITREEGTESKDTQTSSPVAHNSGAKRKKR
jgi:hypothetical protein